MANRMIEKVLVSTALLLSSTTAFAVGPSFNCAKASTNVEKLICSNQILSSDDTDMVQEYKQYLPTSSNPKKLKQAQLAWLKYRNQCGTVECIKSAYDGRSNQFAVAARMARGPDLNDIDGNSKFMPENFDPSLPGYGPVQGRSTANAQPVAQGGQGPSFNCAKASTKVEKTICSDPTLSKYDLIVAQNYKKLLLLSKSDPVFKANQENWMLNTRAHYCHDGDVSCLRKVYKDHIQEQQGYLSDMQKQAK